MSHIFTSFMIFLFFGLSTGAAQKPAVRAELRLPLKELFSHKAHHEMFKENGISCTNCHHFSLKSSGNDPLSPSVGAGYLKPDRQICHSCHFGSVSTPRPNQCTLCHQNTEKLMPENHRLNWRSRHGKMAQMNMDSCKQCHGERSCSECHMLRNALKNMVHRPNFRMTHSIEARANPQSCTTCHAGTAFCTSCHLRGFK